MSRKPGSASSRDLLEAAAISLKMIEAKTNDCTPHLPVLAQRFAVDEIALHEAAGSHAIARLYRRIHSNAAPATGQGPLSPAA